MSRGDLRAPSRVARRAAAGVDPCPGRALRGPSGGLRTRAPRSRRRRAPLRRCVGCWGTSVPRRKHRGRGRGGAFLARANRAGGVRERARG
eukprot:4640909-Alexandrium_andersonii.AAC.1